jgi:hypothetical protein
MPSFHQVAESMTRNQGLELPVNQVSILLQKMLQLQNLLMMMVCVEEEQGGSLLQKMWEPICASRLL